MLRQRNVLNLETAKTALLLVTALTTVAYASFFWLSCRKIASSFEARRFLERIGTVPLNTWHTLLIACVCTEMLAADAALRLFLGETHTRIRMLTILVDMAMSLFVIYRLNFNFNELLFWSFVSVIQSTKETRHSFLAMSSALAVFLVTSPGITAILIPSYRTEHFLSVYSPEHQSMLQIGFNIANVLCLFLFLVCCIFIIAHTQQRIEEINTLYRRISEANRELTDTNARLEDLMLENARMAEIRERNRIAREVHDTLGHTLTGLAVGLDACELLKDEPEVLGKQLDILSQAARQGIEDVRKSVASLKPDALRRKSLIQAIREMIDTTERMTRTEISFDDEVPPMLLDEDEENAIYRTVQEGITNAVQHGHARRIRIRFTREENRIRILIRDNGIGCEHPEEGFGLRHMRERIAMLSGSVTFSSDENGFSVNALIPVRWREENAAAGRAERETEHAGRTDGEWPAGGTEKRDYGAADGGTLNASGGREEG